MSIALSRAVKGVGNDEIEKDKYIHHSTVDDFNLNPPRRVSIRSRKNEEVGILVWNDVMGDVPLLKIDDARVSGVARMDYCTLLEVILDFHKL